MLDAVVNRKNEAGKEACAAAGWRLKIWAADTFGAFHPSTRPLVSKLTSMLKTHYPWKSPQLVSQEVWAALSSAVVARAASQLNRRSDAALFALEGPVSPGDSGNLGHGEQEADTDEEGPPVGAEVGGQYNEGDMGDAEQASAVLGNSPDQPDVEAQQAVPCLPTEDAVRLLIQLPLGAHLPVTAPASAQLGALKTAVREQMGLPAGADANLGLALGHCGLDERRSVRGNDLQSGDTVTLFVRTAMPAT